MKNHQLGRSLISHLLQPVYNNVGEKLDLQVKICHKVLMMLLPLWLKYISFIYLLATFWQVLTMALSLLTIFTPHSFRLGCK